MSSRWQVKVGTAVRTSGTLQGGAIYWGRTDINQQPSPGTATFTFRHTPGDPIDDDLIVGQSIWAYCGASTGLGYNYTRFFGTIVDIQMDQYTYTVTAVTPMARLMNEQFGYKYGVFTGPYYQGFLEENKWNVFNWLAGAQFQVPIYVGDSENYSSYWYDEGTYKIWDFASAFVAGETSGVLGENWVHGGAFPGTTPYTIEFTGAPARRTVNPILTLTETEILQNWQIEQQIADKVNTANISASANDYFGWPEANTLFVNTQDVSDFGAYTLSLAATYSDAASIRKVGTSIVGLQTTPTYRLHKITIPMSTLTDTRQNEIISATSLSALIEIPELVPGFPTLYFLEGTYEVVAQPDGWTLDLLLSEASLTHPPDQWQDVDGFTEWATLPNTLTWNDAYKERFS